MAYRASGSNLNGSSGTTAIQLTIDNSIEVGDIIVFGVWWSTGAHTTFTPSSSNGGSFTDLTGIMAGTDVIAKSQVWRRVAASGDAGSTITISTDASGLVAAAYIASSGLDSSADAVVETGVQTSQDTTLALPAATPPGLTTGGDVIYLGGGIARNSGDQPEFSAGSSGATVRESVSSNSGSGKNACMAILDNSFTGDSTVAAVTISSDVQVDERMGVTILLPAASAPRPVASATAGATIVPVGTTGLQLNGSASDGGGAGGPYTYSWRLVSGPDSVTFSSASAQNPTVSSELDVAGVYVFGLTVTDDDDIASLEDTVSVTVLGGAGTARPITMVTDEGWDAEPSTMSLVETIRDGNSATWIKAVDPAGAVTMETELDPWQPTPGQGATLTVQVRTIGNPGDATVSLREGASTVIKSWPAAPLDNPGTIVTLTMSLTAAEVATISDPNDLRLRVVMEVDGG